MAGSAPLLAGSGASQAEEAPAAGAPGTGEAAASAKAKPSPQAGPAAPSPQEVKFPGAPPCADAPAAPGATVSNKPPPHPTAPMSGLPAYICIKTEPGLEDSTLASARAPSLPAPASAALTASAPAGAPAAAVAAAPGTAAAAAADPGNAAAAAAAGTAAATAAGALSVDDNRSFKAQWSRYALGLPMGAFRALFSPETQAAARERLVDVTVYGRLAGSDEPTTAQLRITNTARLTSLSGFMRDLGVPEGGRVRLTRHKPSGCPLIVPLPSEPQATLRAAAQALAQTAALGKEPRLGAPLGRAQLQGSGKGAAGPCQAQGAAAAPALAATDPGERDSVGGRREGDAAAMSDGESSASDDDGDVADEVGDVDFEDAGGGDSEHGDSSGDESSDSESAGPAGAPAGDADGGSALQPGAAAVGAGDAAQGEAGPAAAPEAVAEAPEGAAGGAVGAGPLPPRRRLSLAPARLASQSPPAGAAAAAGAAASAAPRQQQAALGSLCYRRALSQRMIGKGEMSLRLRSLPAWQALLCALLPADGDRREVQLRVDGRSEPYAAWLARRTAPRGAGSAPVFKIGGLMCWMEDTRAQAYDRAELTAAPDGQLGLRLLRQRAPMLAPEEQQQQPPPQQQQQQSRPPKRRRQQSAAAAAAAAAAAEGGGVMHRITERDVRKSAIRLAMTVVRPLFGELVDLHGSDTDIPVRLLGDSDGSSYEAVLRGYTSKQGQGSPVWTLKRVQPLLAKHGLKPGGTLHMRQAEGEAHGVVRVRCEPAPPAELAAAAAAAAAAEGGPAAAEPGGGAGDGAEGAAAAAAGEGAAAGQHKRPGVSPSGATGRPPKRPCTSLGGRSGAPSHPPPPAPPGPASSITHLHGCVPPDADGSAGLPPLREGELRLCGLTFHPDLAPAVRRVMEQWQAALGDGGLANADPASVQITMPDVAAAPEGIAAAGGGGGSGGDGAWRAVFEQHRLRPRIICGRLARYLGLKSSDADWDAPLSPCGLELVEGVEPVGDAQRGGAGLAATVALRANEVIGVVGGYVMPAAAAAQFAARGFRDCDCDVVAGLAERAAPAELTEAWQFVAGSFRMPYPGLQLTPEGAAGPVPLELNSLGYGNLAALVNDPRVEPRTWVDGSDLDRPPKPNCLVVPVCVRGLVLPVLVALCDIAPGEQLLRDYGAKWWRQLAVSWEQLEYDGLSPHQLLHPRHPAGDSEQEGQPGAGQEHPLPGSAALSTATEQGMEAVPGAGAAATGPAGGRAPGRQGRGESATSGASGEGPVGSLGRRQGGAEGSGCSVPVVKRELSPGGA